MKARGSTCPSCRRRFGSAVRLSMHCDEARHAKPIWLLRLERETAAETAVDVDDIVLAGAKW